MGRAFSLPKLSAIAIIVCFSLLFGLITLSWAGLADSPWPMKGHDPQHTGRSPYGGSATNRLKWFYTLSDFVTSSPAIGSDGTVYIGSGSPSTGGLGKLYAINPDGFLKWSYATVNSIAFSSPAIDSSGTIYVGAGDRLFAIRSDGTPKWRYFIGGNIYSSPAIAADGTIYICDNSHLYAINPNGTPEWNITGATIEASPAIGPDGTVYVGADDGLYAIRPNGTLKWLYLIENKVGESSPAIDANGTIYIGSYAKKLYAINPDGTLKMELYNKQRYNVISCNRV